MRNIIWFLSLFILLVIQAGILLPLHISHINLILIVVALAALLSDFNQGLVITVLGGLLLDFLSGSADGLLSMSMVISFLIVHLLLNEILARDANRFILAASVGGATVIYFAAFIVLTQIFGWIGLAGEPDTRYLLSVQLPLSMMWNLIFTYPIFLFYTLIQNLVSKLPSNEEPIRT
jgi:hypothetical protein